jgi:hypothetical protein
MLCNAIDRYFLHVMTAGLCQLNVASWHFETCSLALTTSVYRERSEVIDGGPSRRD